MAKRKKRRVGRSANKAAFLRGRKAALAAGWKPFTKMTAKQKTAFRSGYHKS